MDVVWLDIKTFARSIVGTLDLRYIGNAIERWMLTPVT
jgi:hypothetical protein